MIAYLQTRLYSEVGYSGYTPIYLKCRLHSMRHLHSSLLLKGRKGFYPLFKADPHPLSPATLSLQLSIITSYVILILNFNCYEDDISSSLDRIQSIYTLTIQPCLQVATKQIIFSYSLTGYEN